MLLPEKPLVYTKACIRMGADACMQEHQNRCTAEQGRTGEEVVADEHAEEHKVIHDALQVKPEGRPAALELHAQVVPQQPGACALSRPYCDALRNSMVAKNVSRTSD